MPPTQEIISVERVTAERRARFDPIRNLTPEKLSTYLNEFAAGHIQNLCRVIEAIEERDDVLATVVPKCKAAVARHGWEVLTVETDDPDERALAERQREVLERFYNHLRVTHAMDRDELGGVATLVRQMMDAKSKRYALHHIVWDRIRTQGQGYTATLIQVPSYFAEVTEGRVRYIEQPFGIYGRDLESGAWMVTRGQGIGIAASVAWMYKRLPLRDWLIYCSRHGMPIIEGITDAPEGSAEWTALVTAVTQVANEFAFVRNRSSEINTIDVSAQGNLPFGPLVERMDRALTAMWRGADLSTISSGQGEGRGASLQGEEADIIEADDCAWISETLQLKLDRLVLDYTFGPNAPALAYFFLRGPERDTTESDLKVDEFAIANGHPISRQQFAERYGRPVPTDDSDLLGAAAMPAPAPGQGTAKVPPDEPEPTAANEAQVSAVNRSFVDRLGIRPGWLGPVQDLIEDLVRKAEDTTINDDELLAFVERAAKRAPEIFGQMDIQALAEVLEAAMGTAVLEGVRSSLHKLPAKGTV